MLLTIFILSTAFSASARAIDNMLSTLIVTHADLGNDPLNVSGPGINRLLRTENFQKHYLITGIGSSDPLNFDTQQREFYEIESDGSISEWDDSNDFITFAGGNLTNCLHQTVLDILHLSTQSTLSLVFQMDAIYEGTKTLAEWHEAEGDNYTKDFIRNFLKSTYQRGKLKLRPSDRTTDDYTLTSYFQGQRLNSVGTGARNVYFHFVADYVR